MICVYICVSSYTYNYTCTTSLQHNVHVVVIFPWLPHPCVTNGRLLAISNLGLAGNSNFGMLKRVAFRSIGIEADPQRAALHMICIHRLSRASMNGSCVFLMCLNNWLEWLFFKIVFTHYIYYICGKFKSIVTHITNSLCYPLLINCTFGNKFQWNFNRTTMFLFWCKKNIWKWNWQFLVACAKEIGTAFSRLISDTFPRYWKR